MTSPNTPPGSERPSMFSAGSGSAASAAGAEAAPGLRMLSGLEPSLSKAKQPQARPRPRWLAATLLGVAVIGTAAVGWHMNRDPMLAAASPEPLTRSQGAGVAAPVANAASLPVAVSPASAVAQAPAPASQNRSAAVIENVATLAGPASSASEAARMAGVDAPYEIAAVASAASSSLASALPASAPKSLPANHPAKARPQPAAQTRVASAHQPPAAGLSGKTARTAAAPRSASVRDRDSDVELLTAMMAHIEGETSGRSAPSPTTQPKTIAQLVHGCGRLGSAEATQCRRKICDGYWGKAQACPAQQAPAGSLGADKSP